MIPPGSALARCVPDPDAFLASGWGREATYTPGADPGGYADLLTLDVVDHLVASSGLRAPAFRMVQGGSTLPGARYLRSARVGSRDIDDLVDAGKAFEAFRGGATMVLQGVHRFWPPVSEFCRDLELSISHPVQANAYITPPTSSGLRVHADGHDVFALQTFGRKHWVVYGRGDEPSLDVHLEPGDALYLPQGTRHAARTVEEPSAHLTIGVRATTWADVLRRATQAALREPELTGRLPAGFGSDAEVLVDPAAAMLAALAKQIAALDPRTIAQEEHRRFLGARQPMLAGMLGDLLAVDRLTDGTEVCRRAGTVCELRPGAQRLRVTLGDRTLDMPARLEDAMRVVADLAPGATLRPSDLAGQLDAEGRLVLVRRLVREGLLTLASRGRGPGA